MSASQQAQAVVVGVDGSTSARHAVQWAAGQAALWGSPLRLVHGHLWPWIERPDLSAMPANLEQTLLEQAKDWLHGASELAARTAPGTVISTELVPNGPVPLLIDESRRARLVVLGSRGLGGFAGLLTGSTSVALAAHGHCPIAVVRGAEADAEPPLSGPVVLGVDGSPASEAAIAFGYEAAAMRGVPLVALHAWSDTTWNVALGSLSMMAGQDAIEQDEGRLLDERLAGWHDKYPDLPVERVVTRDRPAHSLLQAAAGAQLVVVGSRGRGGFRGMLLGSTSQALLHHAPCPVVVVRSHR